MLEKPKYVENRESWRREYGSILNQMDRIRCNLSLVNKYIELDEKPLNILDIGCAYGYYLQILKLLNPDHECYGVEIAEDAVNQCRKIIGNNNIFWQSSSEKIPLNDESFHLIFLFDCIEHIPNTYDIEATLKECHRLLKNNGYLFIRTPANNLQTRICATLIGQRAKFVGKDHPNLFDEKTLKKLIEPYFNVIEIIYYNRGLKGFLKFFFNFFKLGDMTLMLSKGVDDT